MDIEKIKSGQTYNYRTPTGKTGRGKVEEIIDNNWGKWVVIADKTRNRYLKLRATMLSR